VIFRIFLYCILKGIGEAAMGGAGGGDIIFHTQWKEIHRKKRLAIFPSPAGMSLTKLSLVGNNLIIPAQREFGK
jgi:hypothetical protein